MKIVIVINSIIPAIKYGGTERVIWYLGQELHKMGHTITYLAPKGSYCDFAQIIERNPAVPVSAQIPVEADIVHFQGTIPEGVNKPYITTIHGNGVPANADRNLVFVSRNHAQRFGSNSFVYNGLDWEDYGPANLKLPRSRYHFLGKAAWKVKNFKGAMAVTKAIKGGQLDVLGGYRFNFKMGMRFTFSPQIHFHGMVDNSAKKAIIERSKGLIFPVTWHEPFGLAITESLYYGSPVFGTPYGSLPELVPNQVGYLSNKASELIHHMKEADYSPVTCNEYARDLFNSQIMAQEYLKKYEAVLNGESLNPEIPQAIDIARNLPWE
ncbi:glycosyltransferase [Bacteroides reticulotermitis]|uniref:Glycosyltransferase n=2 Tax=Bacteroides reticulotermitis TaxID=1133319 RepID=W4UYC9_9BACE|nr:glycosyltransferase [Bacteroides reticulotermitis]MBB4042478.1 glycosyltransferase involved in cell wall biosynthesis [Bacteroides reticulotermitis]GAE85598.1 glycosyltransferase [Bacteroides reticulotermitis JCM 10512]